MQQNYRYRRYVPVSSFPSFLTHQSCCPSRSWCCHGSSTLSVNCARITICIVPNRWCRYGDITGSDDLWFDSSISCRSIGRKIRHVGCITFAARILHPSTSHRWPDSKRILTLRRRSYRAHIGIVSSRKKDKEFGVIIYELVNVLPISAILMLSWSGETSGLVSRIKYNGRKS